MIATTASENSNTLLIRHPPLETELMRSYICRSSCRIEYFLLEEQLPIHVARVDTAFFRSRWIKSSGKIQIGVPRTNLLALAADLHIHPCHNMRVTFPSTTAVQHLLAEGARIRYSRSTACTFRLTYPLMLPWMLPVYVVNFACYLQHSHRCTKGIW